MGVDIDYLRKSLLDRWSKDDMDLLAEQIMECENLKDVYMLSKDTEPKLVFRSAWLLQKVCEKDLNRAETFLDLLLNDFDRIENHSAFRSYAKIISMLLSRKAMGTLSDSLIAILSDEKNVERIIEGCFNYIIKEKRIISVISHCCDILSYYAQDKDWIREQLLIESDKMLVNGSAASVVCSKRLKERLKS